MKKDNLPAVHPGEYIADGIDELGMNQSQLADILGCSRQIINDVIKGRKGLSQEMCLLLPAVLGSTTEFWSDLQQRYDLKTAENDPVAALKLKDVQSRMAKWQAGRHISHKEKLPEMSAIEEDDNPQPASRKTITHGRSAGSGRYVPVDKARANNKAAPAITHGRAAAKKDK